jgi:hypothetical protein
MCTKKNIVVVTSVVLVLLLFSTAWNVFAASILGASDDYENSIQWGKEMAWSPAGVWVVSVPTPMGNILFLHNMYAQDMTGTRWGGVMWQVNENPTTFGMFSAADKGTGYWATQSVRTGPDTIETTMITYGTKARENAPDEIVTIAIGNSKWRTTGPDTNEGNATLAMYLASQDADGDGFPDQGQEPVTCMSFPFSSHRLRVMPGCTPTPTPAPAK